MYDISHVPRNLSEGYRVSSTAREGVDLNVGLKYMRVYAYGGAVCRNDWFTDLSLSPMQLK